MQSNSPPTLLILGLVLLGSSIILFGWNYYILSCHTLDDTICRRVFTLSKQEPIVPLLVGLTAGLILGHIFWNH